MINMTYHKAKPSPQYGSRHSAICRLGYSSQANFMLLQRFVTAACDILIPANIPVVDTLKSRYANISAVGARYATGNFFFGISSVSSIIGHDFISTYTKYASVQIFLKLQTSYHIAGLFRPQQLDDRLRRQNQNRFRNVHYHPHSR